MVSIRLLGNGCEKKLNLSCLVRIMSRTIEAYKRFRAYFIFSMLVLKIDMKFKKKMKLTLLSRE